MKRIDIINAVNNIKESFLESRIAHYIFISSEKEDIEGLLIAFQTYSEYYKTFGDVEKRILEIFDLGNLSDAKLWTTLLTKDRSESRELTRPYWAGIRTITDYLPQIVELLKQDNIAYAKVENNLEEQSPSELELLKVILPEEHNQQSSPERLIKVLEAVNLLYNAFADLSGVQNNTLSVAAIDSGSDKSFDFLGAAKIIEQVKELIIGLWDRIVFHREKKMAQRLELIAQSLPIISEISTMVEKETMSPQQGEILRRNILQATENFISVGAVIPEFQINSTFSPRQLMAPEPKLLAQNESISNESHGEKNFDTNSDSFNEDLGFSAEETKAIRDILKNRGKKQKK